MKSPSLPSIIGKESMGVQDLKISLLVRQLLERAFGLDPVHIWTVVPG